MALEKGCDYLISIDDDNLCLEGRSFLEDHAVVCAGTRELESVYTSTGWFNVLSLMEVTPSNVYPRGFPYRFRHLPVETCWRSEMGVVHWNSGLWLQDPDLDAATWLVSPANAQSFRGRSVVLGRDTWSPLNTQNTAIHRDAAVAFYFVRMGHALAGMPTGRWGDILSGYLSQACMRHLGYRVRVGTLYSLDGGPDRLSSRTSFRRQHIRGSVPFFSK
jgi:hypothetical protein